MANRMIHHTLRCPKGVCSHTCCNEVQDLILQVAAGVVGCAIEQDAPLMEVGLDSLSAVDFRNQAGLAFEVIVVSVE